MKNQTIIYNVYRVDINTLIFIKTLGYDFYFHHKNKLYFTREASLGIHNDLAATACGRSVFTSKNLTVVNEVME